MENKKSLRETRSVETYFAICEKLKASISLQNAYLG